jgi:CheY-like chemotaxis protein
MPKKILIAEDDPRNARVMVMALRPHGYTLLEATDVEEALEIAVKDKPDLILMDIRLPKMCGLEVTRRLRQMPAFLHTPIIAVTAYAMKGDREKFIQAGCDAYLSKPINTRELPSLIAGMLSPRQEDKT